ncbi:MAG: LURP-one-related/scramblase family protein [Eubacteriales bacterium]
MKLLFKQRMFSWFGSYDIYNEDGENVYTVEGQLAWGRCLKIFDRSGEELASVEQKLFRFLPTYEVYLHGEYVGCVRKEFSFFAPRFTIDFMGWQVEGHFLEWDYEIYSGTRLKATVSKECFNWTDTYVIDVGDPTDALPALALVIAIDVEKESRD